MEKKLKVFNVSGYGGYWIDNSIETTFKEADIVIFPGGGDWNPALYGQKVNSKTWFNENTDKFQLGFYEMAVREGKFIIGICRGGQLLTIKAGGSLVQHVTGHQGHHKIIDVRTGKTYSSNSIHHQMFNVDGIDEYEVIAVSPGLSTCYLDGDDNNIDIKQEIEIAYYPKINGLAFQNHPEMTGKGPSLDYYNELVLDYFNKSKQTQSENRIAKIAY